MKSEKSCGAIIVNDKNQVLIVRQNEGHYSFPKGHVEANESEQETAIRETKEETNIDIEIITNKRFTINYYVKNNVPKEVIYFIAKPISFNLKEQQEEISESMWVPLNKVPKYLSFDNIKELWYKEILKEINNQ